MLLSTPFKHKGILFSSPFSLTIVAFFRISREREREKTFKRLSLKKTVVLVFLHFVTLIRTLATERLFRLIVERKTKSLIADQRRAAATAA